MLHDGFVYHTRLCQVLLTSVHSGINTGCCCHSFVSEDVTARHSDMVSTNHVLGQAKLVKQLLGPALGVIAEVGHTGQTKTCTLICVLTSCAQWKPWIGTP